MIAWVETLLRDFNPQEAGLGLIPRRTAADHRHYYHHHKNKHYGTLLHITEEPGSSIGSHVEDQIHVKLIHFTRKVSKPTCLLNELYNLVDGN